MESRYFVVTSDGEQVEDNNINDTSALLRTVIKIVDYSCACPARTSVQQQLESEYFLCYV